MYTAIGWIGMILFLGNYAALANGKIQSASKLYNWIQIGAAVAIAISLLPGEGTLPTILLELAFVAIGLTAIFKKK
jgi:hypothetical protein